MIGYEGAVLLYAHKDTLQPYPLKEMHGKIAAGKQNWISILINYRAELSEVKQIHLSVYARSADTTKLRPIEDNFGLQSYKIAPRRGEKDIFFHQEMHRTTDVICCGRPPSTRPMENIPSASIILRYRQILMSMLVTLAPLFPIGVKLGEASRNLLAVLYNIRSGATRPTFCRSIIRAALDDRNWRFCAMRAVDPLRTWHVSRLPCQMS